MQPEKKYVNYVLFRFQMRDPRFEFVKNSIFAEDFKSAIIEGFLEAKNDKDAWRLSRRNCERLFASIDYSKHRIVRDKFTGFFEDTDHSDIEWDALEWIEVNYQNGNFTAREVAQYFNVKFNNRFAKLLHFSFPKNMGLGGCRKGSGAKKKN